MSGTGNELVNATFSSIPVSTIYISLLLFLRKETRYYQLACHWTVITQLSAAGHIWDTFLWPLYPGTVTKSELVSMNWEAAVDISPDCEIIRNVATSDTLAAVQLYTDHCWPMGPGPLTTRLPLASGPQWSGNIAASVGMLETWWGAH